jgi:hypothetical protein
LPITAKPIDIPAYSEKKLIPKTPIETNASIRVTPAWVRRLLV